MSDINISGATSAHVGKGVLTPTEQAVFKLLHDHEIPDILTHASGSPSQRLVGLITALAELIDHATDVVVDQLSGNGFAVCARRPTSECGYSWPFNPDDDVAAEKRVLVVGQDGKRHVCCGQQCADAVIGVQP